MAWANKYNEFIESNWTEEIHPIDNTSLFDPIEFVLRSDIREDSDYVFINEKTWNFLK